MADAGLIWINRCRRPPAHPSAMERDLGEPVVSAAAMM